MEVNVFYQATMFANTETAILVSAMASYGLTVMMHSDGFDGPFGIIGFWRALLSKLDVKGCQICSSGWNFFLAIHLPLVVTGMIACMGAYIFLMSFFEAGEQLDD